MSTATIASPAYQQTFAGFARKLLSYIWPPIVTLGIFVGIWYVISYFLLPDAVKYILPTPHEVVDVGVLTWSNFKIILEGLWGTSQVVLIGLGISVAIGVLVATLMSQARWIERTLFPYAVAVQAVPIVAIVPLIGIFWDYGFNARVIVCIIISIFPIISNTAFGLRCAEANLHDLLTLNGAGRFTRLWKLQYPAALPAFFTGLRISAGLGVVGTIVGEFFFSRGEIKGLGRLITKAWQVQAHAPQIYAAIFFSCALGVVLFWFAGGAGRAATRHWQE